MSGPCGLHHCVLKHRKREGWRRTPSQEVGGLGLGLCVEKLTLQTHTSCFWHVELPPFFSILKQDPAGPGPFPWRLFIPGLVLSSAFCCLDLLLRSWYKYHTFSWTGYSWNTEQRRASWPRMRKLKTEIKRGGALSEYQGMTEWKRVSFHALMTIWLLCTCSNVSERYLWH